MLKKTASSLVMLKNGLTAKIFCLNDARARTIASAGSKMSEDYRKLAKKLPASVGR